MARNGRHIFLTGFPGVGKTTVVKNVVRAIEDAATVTGFYTEEIRKNNSRIGFDAVAVHNDNRCALARIEESECFKRRPKVGKYSVYVEEFENFAIPIFSTATENKVFVLDEVGKMELFSSAFKSHVSKLLSCNDVTVLGTIPVRKGAGIPFVERIRSSERVMVYDVNTLNRNSLPQVIAPLLC